MPILEDLIGTVQTYAVSGGDKTLFWLGFVFMFILIYFLSIWFFFENNKSWALLFAYVPFLLLDATVSFGKYTFKLPFLEHTVDKGVLTLNWIDYIFNFGILKSYGLETFNTVSGVHALDAVQNATVFVLMYADNIIEFLLIAYFLYAVFGKMEWAILISAILTVAWMILMNPVKEMAKAQETVSHTLYFIDNATQTQMIVVFGSALVSFGLIVFLLSTAIALFIGTGKRTFRPSMEESQWTTNFTGVAYGLSCLYTIAQFLHPEYTWHIVLPALIVYGIIRGGMNDYAGKRRNERHEQDRIKNIIDEYRGGHQ